MIVEFEIYKLLEKILKNKNIIVCNIFDKTAASFFSPILIKALNDFQSNDIKKLINQKINIKNFDSRMNFKDFQTSHDLIEFIKKEEIEVAAFDQSFYLIKKSTTIKYQEENLNNFLRICKFFESDKNDNLQQLLFIQHASSSRPLIEPSLECIRNVPVYVIFHNHNQILINSISGTEKYVFNLK